MGKKALSKILKGAGKTYSTNSNSYEALLENRAKVFELNELIGNDFNISRQRSSISRNAVEGDVVTSEEGFAMPTVHATTMMPSEEGSAIPPVAQGDSIFTESIKEGIDKIREESENQSHFLQEIDSKTLNSPPPTNAAPAPTVNATAAPAPAPAAPAQAAPVQAAPAQAAAPQQPVPNINIQTDGKSVNPGNINIVAKNYIDTENLDGKKDDKYIKELEEAKHKKLTKLPDKLLKESTTDWEPINYRDVNVAYDLYELSKVTISYDETTQKVMYVIDEPTLTPEEQTHLDELKKGFIYVFEKFSPEFINISGRDLIVEGAKKLCLKYKIKLTEDQLRRISYFLVRDFLGLELIEPIMHDPYIEDVSCDGLNTPIFVNHLKYGPLEVNRKYTDVDKLNSFIIKLAQKSNQEVSLSKPILQGALPDGSRIEAIYGKEVSEKGSSFTIRKFREEPFTPIHLIDLGTMPAFVLAYLWLAVENKQSILVSGGTATGKTTILNALSLFVPANSKIVSIEDTPEINLPHEHWLTLVAREAHGKSEVSMFDLLKASLRERPDYIIVGEIRGVEASILFQGMATGHAGLGTVHAEKFEDLVNRMTIAPINLPKQLLTELNIVVFMKQMKVKNNMVRRSSSIVELVGYEAKADAFMTNEFVRYHPSGDEFEIKSDSAIISQLIELRGGKEDSIWTEIERRRRILDFMHKNKIMEFKDVSDILKTYYKNPSGIFDYMENYSKKLEEEGGRKE